MMIDMAKDLLQQWLTSDGTQFVMGAYVSVLIGHFGMLAFLETVVRHKKTKLIEWKGSDRRKDIDEIHKTIPWIDQFKQGAWFICGPVNILGCILASFAINLIPGGVSEFWPSSWTAFCMHVLALSLITDFGTYLGHLLQHRVPVLYERFHSFHHQIRTPGPASAGYIDVGDTLLEAVLPLLVAIAIVPAQRFTVFAYLTYFLATTVMDHCGIDEWWLEIIGLRFLPFRCPSWWHDAHHRFGDHKQAKNFGALWTIFDIIGGTACSPEAYAKLRKESKE